MARQVCLLAALGLVLLALGAQARIHHSPVEHDDRKLIPLTDAFGFADGGEIEITVSDVAIYQRHDSSEEIDLQVLGDHFGFFLSSVEADAALEQDLSDESKCVLDDVHNLFTFKDSALQNIVKGKADNATFKFVVKGGGLYYLYFANCEQLTPVSFDAWIEMYNVGSDGVTRDYLSLGETELSSVYFVMFALFMGCGVAWGYYLWQNRQHLHKIHNLMTVLVFLKAFAVLARALQYHFLERTGHSDGWNVVYYCFAALRGILFFTVVVLIGTGWSYMKPFLGDREKRILLVVVPLQVFANIAIIITEEESPAIKDWFTWRDVFHLVDIICCCAILFPIVWSIKHLREASQTDGKAARNLEKLTLFRQFYVTVVVYIYFTRIVVYLLRSTMPYQYTWASNAAEEMATLAFYVWTALRFRPHETNPYLKLQQQEIEL